MMKLRTSLVAASFVIASVPTTVAAPYTFQTVTIPNGPVFEITLAACAARGELDGIEIEDGSLYIARTKPKRTPTLSSPFPDRRRRSPTA